MLYRHFFRDSNDHQAIIGFSRQDGVSTIISPEGLWTLSSSCHSAGTPRFQSTNSREARTISQGSIYHVYCFSVADHKDNVVLISHRHYLKIAYKIQSRQHRRTLEYIWASFVYNKSIGQIPQCIRRISRNVLFCNWYVHTCALFCYKMHVGYWTGALCDLCNRSFCCIKFCLIVMNLHYHPHVAIVVNDWSTYIMSWLKNIGTR